MKKIFLLLVFLIIINLSVVSQNANDYYTTAIGNIKRDNFELALKNLNKAIEMDPKYKDAYFSRGVVYHATNKFDQAIKDYNKAMELEFNSIDLYYYRGLAYYELKNYDNALVDFTKVLEDPNNNFFLIYMRRADIYYLQKKYDLAINDFNKVILIVKNDYYAYFLRLAASLKVSKEKYLTEINELKKIENKIEDSWQKAIASFLTGTINVDKFLTESKNEKEKLCEAYFYIGIDYLSKNDNEKMKSYFNKCIETGLVKFTEYKYAQAELNNLK